MRGAAETPGKAGQGVSLWSQERSLPPNSKYNLEPNNPPKGPRALGNPDHEPWATPRQRHPQGWEQRRALSLPAVTVWGQAGGNFSKNTRSPFKALLPQSLSPSSDTPGPSHHPRLRVHPRTGLGPPRVGETEEPCSTAALRGGTRGDQNRRRQLPPALPLHRYRGLGAKTCRGAGSWSSMAEGTASADGAGPGVAVTHASALPGSTGGLRALHRARRDGSAALGVFCC